MSNALAREASPYLRQHADNPVDWLPWGPEALARARELDRPLLVSIGYSSCHWCHVMERESFEDPRTAALMNEEFVCVKVDREERPDVDALYMEAVQLMTGQGGWPLNVFLTPEQLPFYGGTYYPPDPRPGLPAWTQVLQAIAEAWSERREEVRAGGERLSGGAQLQVSDEPLSADALDRAVAGLREVYDSRSGGFGRAPKFPQASVLEFLLLRSDRQAMALDTLRAMASGGIYDQLGGGFHRYSVDATWTVPHFEKMLYDNALLARAYLHGFNVSGDPRLADICRETLDWALREMRGPEGGFYSALDADSEGVEGRYYVWTEAQIREALDDGAEENEARRGWANADGQADSIADMSEDADADATLAWLGITERGNFADPHHPEPGLNVLTLRGPEPPDADTRARIRARLLNARAARTRPGLDDKRLTSWNALMIAALAEAGAATGLNEPRYSQAAIACAEFLLDRMRDNRGRLLRTYNDGRVGGVQIGAFLEDHAFLVEALLVLFETTCEARWFDEAASTANTMIARFAGESGFYSTASDSEQLIARRIDLEDTPIPAGQSSAAMGLLRLAQLTGNPDYQRHAETTLRLLAPIAPRHPTMFGHALQAMHWYYAPARPIACAVPSAADT